jgi:DNA-binding PadR family transcriptional regulator
MSSGDITAKAVPTAGTIAGRLKIESGLVMRLLRNYEKMGYVITRKIIAAEIAEPRYATKRGKNVEHNRDCCVAVYALTTRGREKLKYLDTNRDAFSRIWLSRWVHR